MSIGVVAGGTFDFSSEVQNFMIRFIIETIMPIYRKEQVNRFTPVSYTPLDVYKRQVLCAAALSAGNVVCLCIQHCKSGNPKITEKCDEDGREGSDG